MWNDIKTLNTLTRVMLGVLVLALMYSGYRWTARMHLFELTEIQVRAVPGKPLRYVDESTVRSTAVQRLRGNFFSMDLAAARAAFETVPWVQHASVRREWPNKLVVTIDEFVALGTWGEQGRLISVDGVLFTANLDEAEQEGKLPALDGPDESAREVAQRMFDLRQWLAPVKLSPRALSLSKRYAWSARLDNGILLHLGRANDRAALKARIDRLVSVYPRLASALPGRIEAIDMRYPNGLALKRRAQPIGSNNATEGAT
jgi:cell division protein FtsQ